MTHYQLPDDRTLQALRDIANRLRILSIKATCASNSGHPTSCCSAAEIMSVLFFHVMRYKVNEPRDPNSDRFVLSKGHAAPILYAAWVEAGYVKEAELMNLRKLGCLLEGHPTPKLAFVDVATGSLGQGLGAACGMAYTGKYFDHASYRVYCLIGDGESSEGSIWEAMAFASFYKLDNLVAIFDVNRLGQSEPAPLQHDVDTYYKRCEAFGWNTYIVDGHNVEDLCKALGKAGLIKDRPTAIVAKTFKGKGIKGVENEANWHGKPMPKDHVGEILREIEDQIQTNEPLKPTPPQENAPVVDISAIKMPSPPSYKLGDKIATRKAYGLALAKLGHANQRVVALDGDTKNSTFSDLFRKEHPDRFIECYIAEQNMISVAIGCATRDRTVVFASTFAAFLSRGYDQIRMGAISQSNVNFSGSHCGISIGEDGPSQMALEDIAMFRAIPTCTVFYPSDGVSTEHAVELAANTQGICFIRTSRPETAIIYSSDEEFKIGQAKVVLQKESDSALVIGAGITLHEALAAAKQLAAEGINIRVLDPFTVKPLDAATIIANAKAVGGRIITVEDHYREGGLGEAVSAAVCLEPGILVHRLAVSGIAWSAKPAELLDAFGISAGAIVAAVRSVLAN
ncbi:transketolase-like protein 2 [Heterodontus francisci]|uniref:transketolase-like protein 2 n=1 Tax=Heterodontus francisci TaxID=7792 RepID=UPI00355C7D57